MAKTPSKPSQQQGGSQTPSQQQGQQGSNTPSQQQGQTVIRDWAAF